MPDSLAIVLAVPRRSDLRVVHGHALAGAARSGNLLAEVAQHRVHPVEDVLLLTLLLRIPRLLYLPHERLPVRQDATPSNNGQRVCSTPPFAHRIVTSEQRMAPSDTAHHCAATLSKHRSPASRRKYT